MPRWFKALRDRLKRRGARAAYVRQTGRATPDRSSFNVHEGPAVWIVNGCDHHRRSCLVRYASCCPVRDVVCSVVRAVLIFAALFYSHGSRPDRRPVSWQGASLAWDTILSESGFINRMRPRYSASS
jgi:hypothetical protein